MVFKTVPQKHLYIIHGTLVLWKNVLFGHSFNIFYMLLLVSEHPKVTFI